MGFSTDLQACIHAFYYLYTSKPPNLLLSSLKFQISAFLGQKAFAKFSEVCCKGLEGIYSIPTLSTNRISPRKPPCCPFWPNLAGGAKDEDVVDLATRATTPLEQKLEYVGVEPTASPTFLLRDMLRERSTDELEPRSLERPIALSRLVESRLYPCST